MDKLTKRLDDINNRLDVIDNSISSLEQLLNSDKFACIREEYPTYHADLLSMAEELHNKLTGRKTVTIIGDGKSGLKVDRTLYAAPCGHAVSSDDE